jgi:hypothetical protein
VLAGGRGQLRIGQPKPFAGEPAQTMRRARVIYGRGCGEHCRVAKRISRPAGMTGGLDHRSAAGKFHGGHAGMISRDARLSDRPAIIVGRDAEKASRTGARDA